MLSLNYCKSRRIQPLRLTSTARVVIARSKIICVLNSRWVVSNALRNVNRNATRELAQAADASQMEAKQNLTHKNDHNEKDK